MMEGADIVCLTSSSEALPMVVLEAMAAGRAVVSTRVGDVGDIIDRSGGGVAVDAADFGGIVASIASLAVDHELRRALGAAGRLGWELEFESGSVVDRFEATLQTAALESSRRRRR